MVVNTYPPEALKRIQEIELDILLAIDEVCKKNNLTYFIDGGTLLGAIRHGGFIPWDDDVDLGLPHDDYLKFLDAAAQDLPAEYELCTPEAMPKQAALWTKVVKKGTRFIDSEAAEGGYEQGIFVDVFDFRQFDKNPNKKARQIRNTVFWQRLSYLKNTANPHIPKGTRFVPLVKAAFHVAHALASVFVSRDTIIKQLDKSWQTNNPDEFWMNASCAYKTPYSSDILFPTRPIQFGGKTLMGPNKPEEFLETLFGDYMKLPPEEERHNHFPIVLDFGDGVNVMDELG